VQPHWFFLCKTKKPETKNHSPAFIFIFIKVYLLTMNISEEGIMSPVVIKVVAVLIFLACLVLTITCVYYYYWKTGTLAQIGSKRAGIASFVSAIALLLLACLSWLDYSLRRKQCPRSFGCKVQFFLSVWCCSAFSLITTGRLKLELRRKSSGLARSFQSSRFLLSSVVGDVAQAHTTTFFINSITDTPDTLTAAAKHLYLFQNAPLHYIYTP